MNPRLQTHNERGNALLLTLIMSAVALAILASMMTWGSSSARLTHRSIQYTRSVAAAEAADEKVFSQIRQDFLSGGEPLVANKLNFYRQNTVPTAADSSYWRKWEFNDANGNIGQTYVQRPASTSYIVLDSIYAGLKGYVSTYTVVSHARDRASMQDVIGGVYEEVLLTQIPIFQFTMYSSGDMEISCGRPFAITGRVHSNKALYVEPDSSMTFESGVTAVTDILFQRDPLDPRGPKPNGSVVYVHPDQKVSPVTAMTLPIGTTNTPEAIREIIEPPPPGEDANSPLGRLRYYNQSELVLTVADSGTTATSGEFDSFQTRIPPAQLDAFVSTASSFHDAREGKLVKPIDINVGALKTWSETNNTLNPRLAANNAKFTSLYVVDKRHLPPTNLGAVRVLNGKNLPVNGLTVATARPLYVSGNYNQQDPANLGTSNTSTTLPASLVADAITILSDGWQDANSVLPVDARVAQNTTVNAAFLTGVVETTDKHYSGGMENFPRFLETWGPITITYNGSMIKMFPSLYATNAWENNKNIYTPPTRNWAYDINFDDQSKLPPKTPSLLLVSRGRWSTVPPGQNTPVIP